MSAEQPNFEAGKQFTPLPEFQASSSVGQPKGVSLPESSTDSKEPTEAQLFWRDIYRTGKLSPYQKDRPGIDFKVAAEAWQNPQTQGVESRIMAVDLALRGGADKDYNQLGPMSHRARRMVELVKNTVPYFLFDVATSIPSSLMFEYANLTKKDNSQYMKGLLSGATKTIEVLNDKVVTALGDIRVANRTGEKGAFTHEVWDKMADLGQSAADDFLKDAINGPVLESVNRAFYEVPIAGAIWEQIWTRVSGWQEKSQLNKGIAKSFYMGIGMGIGVFRDLKNQDPDKKRSPSALISRGVWKVILPRVQAWRAVA